MSSTLIKTVFAILLGVAALAALLWSFLPPNQDPNALRRLKAAEGIELAIERHAPLELSSLVLGREVSDGRFDFRGAVKGEARDEPIYGEARLTCPEIASAPDCWALEELYRNGRPWLRSMASFSTGAAASLSAPNEPATAATAFSEDARGGSGLEASRSQSSPSFPAAESTLDLDPADSASDLESASPAKDEAKDSFRVVAEVVNGRSGPGMQHEILAKLTPELVLWKLAEQDGWGLFRVEQEAAGGSEIWVLLDLVEPIEDAAS